jgi:succinate dehydrogenase/fumarate reductase flavoprotein subunit
MNIVKSDILVIGGGLTGCFAALRGSALGKDVVLLEKATIRRGGSVGPGMDHVNVGVHPDFLTLEVAKDAARKKRKELYDPNVWLTIDMHSYARCEDLESFGVPIHEDDGSLRVWELKERSWSLVSYRGKDTKVKLAEAVRKTSTRIFERTMGVELIKDGDRIIGALGLNTRSGEFTVFLAKATIMGTGESGRQFIEPDGAYMTYFPVTNCGDTGAMCFRAGAKMVNMEFVYIDYTSARAGGGIAGIKPMDIMGKLVNRNGDSLINGEHDSLMRTFNMIKETTEGRGPLYWDFRHLPEDVIQCYEREMEHEWPICMEWFKQRGLDLRKTLIPIQLDPTCIYGGPLIDETFATSVPGLYVGGAATPFIIGLTESGVAGYIAAEQAAEYIKGVKLQEPTEAELEKIVAPFAAPYNRKEGMDPKSLEIALRDVLTDYVGYFKNEGMMTKGLEKLHELKDAFLDNMSAYDPHELMRCCEVRSISDMIEMHIRASLFRKETRMRRVGCIPHFRTDYPKTNPEWEKFVVLKKIGSDIRITTEEVPELKEYLY